MKKQKNVQGFGLKLMLVSSLILGSLFGLVGLDAQASTKPLALVWYGPGACKPSCAVSAVQVARRAGFRVFKVTPKNLNQVPFDRADIWVQPGGKSTTAAKAMGPEFMQRVRSFVENGGGYVGYCAGMFISTASIGTSGMEGFGFVPGKTILHLKHDPKGHVIPMKRESDGKKIFHYYAGGPEIHFTEDEARLVEVKTRYTNGAIAGVRTMYGFGRVAVVGTHPEAGFAWKAFKLTRDPDGSDRREAIQMMKWATRGSSQVLP